MTEAPRSPDHASWLPRTIVLLGTDAAGKNHVARVWARRLHEQGVDLTIHEGWLAAPATGPDGDDDKSFFSHLAEQVFLLVFPLIGWIMPPILNWLIRRDARRFTDDGQRRLIVSHSALRILAFTLGARGRTIETLPASSRRAVRELHRQSRAIVFVLDVDPDVRRRRIEERVERSDSDPFDRYMLTDMTRAERIEAFLVDLATRQMDAHLIVNNQLDDDALWTELEEACRAESALKST